MKLIDQVHELEIKAGEDGLSKEGFNSIVDKRNKLATQEDRWKEQWKKRGMRRYQNQRKNTKKLNKKIQKSLGRFNLVD